MFFTSTNIYRQYRHKNNMAAEFVASDLGLEAAGLEGHPCIDAAGGLNGCGAAVAIISGLCACEGGYSGHSGDKADM